MSGPSTANAQSDVGMFVLAFDLAQTRVQQIQDVFVRIAQMLPCKYGRYYSNWNASLHRVQGCMHLWLRFKFDVTCGREFLRRLQGDLSGMAGSSAFCLDRVDVQTEARSFGQGAPDPCNDVFTGVGGGRGMPDLWRQMQSATEWAAGALNGAGGHQPLAGWFCYACHLYWNLIWQDCGCYRCPTIRLSACPHYSKTSGRPWP